MVVSCQVSVEIKYGSSKEQQEFLTTEYLSGPPLLKTTTYLERGSVCECVCLGQRSMLVFLKCHPPFIYLFFEIGALTSLQLTS